MKDYSDADQEISHIKEDKSKDFRGRHLNKLSRRFAAQLRSTFTPATEESEKIFNPAEIYFAKSPLTSTIQYPVDLPQFQLNSCTSRRNQQRLLIVPKPPEHLSLDPLCTSVLIEKLDETQELLKHGYFNRRWGSGLTLTPISHRIQLNFNGCVDFQSAVNLLAEEHFGEGSVVQLNAGNVASPVQRIHKTKATPKDLEYQDASWDRRHHTYNSNEKPAYSKEIFDEEDHNFILIPSFSKRGFDSCAIKAELQFPFETHFMTNGGESLKHVFRIPLKFQASPQKFRLKFIFQKKDDSKIVCYSHLMVYSIMPETTQSPTIEASIQIYKRNSPKWNQKCGDDRFWESEECGQLEKRLVRRFFDTGDIDKYWGTGKRIRYNTIHVETLAYNGFKIGFNYDYEIKPRPNSERRIDNHRDRIRTRKQLRRNIRSELQEYYSSASEF